MQKNNALILTEGIADIIFLRDYLTFLNPQLEIVEPSRKEKGKVIKLKADNQIITIRFTDGYTNIQNQKSTIEQFEDKMNKILVIQDADDNSKNHGGYKNRIEYLNSIKDAENIKFETFLFPNNNDDGDLETLLLRIVEPQKFNSININYKNYAQLEGKLGYGYEKELLEDKSIVFNYLRTQYGMSNSSERNRVYCQTSWQFGSNNLEKLKTFFVKNNII